MLVGSKFLQNKWNTDVRKFSRYFENSHYWKELQVGATVEGNLIFSQVKTVMSTGNMFYFGKKNYYMQTRFVSLANDG